jgi:16S rRNA pseudouridine516 synthase
MRLDKHLADMKVDTRSNLKKAIRKSAVTVNGEIERDPGRHVSETDLICYEGRQIRYEAMQYYLMNKPKGLVSATEDCHQKTVIDLLPEDSRKDLFPVGRLDKDTTGLLLITNDGDLAHRLLQPGKHVDKTYIALVDGKILDKHVKAFAKGLVMDEDWTALPAKLTLLSEEAEGSVAEIVIREGKFHQIKRMFEVIGMEVLELTRVKMGPLELDPDLEEGEYRKLREEELRELGL